MCGIFGVVAAHSCYKLQESFLVDAMQAGQVRGGHGSGMFTVSPTGYVRNKALAVPGTAFLRDKRAKDVLGSATTAKIVVGHNRFTTSGKDIDQHCHPFRYEHVVGVHNGGVGGGILNKINPKGKHEVDSARIYAALDAVDDPLDVLKQITTGAYCLVWYDGRKRSLFMARNYARPMHVAETHAGLYFASEMGMLTWLLGRHSNAASSQVKLGKLNPNTLYEIPLDNGKETTATPYEVAYPIVGRGTGRGQLLGGAPRGNVHKYYTGSHLYGGDPGPVAYKRYYSEVALVRDFPSTKRQIEIVGELQSDNSAFPEIPFMLLGLGTDMLGDDCAFGMVSTPDGGKQHDSILVSCTLRTQEEVDHLKGMLEDGAQEGPKPEEWGYPIIPLQFRSALLRPTGELVLAGELPKDFNPEELDEVTWMYEVDKRTTGWVKTLVGPEYLTNLKEDQLISTWIDLRNGKTQVLSDDVPAEVTT